MKRGTCRKCKRPDLGLPADDLCGKCYKKVRKAAGTWPAKKGKTKKKKERAGAEEPKKKNNSVPDIPDKAVTIQELFTVIEKDQEIIQAMEKEIAILAARVEEQRTKKLEIRFHLLRSELKLKQLMNERLTKIKESQELKEIRTREEIVALEKGEEGEKEIKGE